MKVFLKFNRLEPHSEVCLIHWLKIFENYDIILSCDIENIKNILKLSNEIKILKTDYTLSKNLPFKFKNKNRSSPNLTCMHYAKSDEYCWIIDADDTMFLTKDYDIIREKIKKAEDYARYNKLDAFSLDFYRETNNDHWSFGVCLIKNTIKLNVIESLDKKELKNYPELSKNLDSWLDILRRKNIYNLKSFVFENTSFQHTHYAEEYSPKHGIYAWYNRLLSNQIQLKDDVVSL